MKSSWLISASLQRFLLKSFHSFHAVVQLFLFVVKPAASQNMSNIMMELFRHHFSDSSGQLAAYSCCPDEITHVRNIWTFVISCTYAHIQHTLHCSVRLGQCLYRAQWYFFMSLSYHEYKCPSTPKKNSRTHTHTHICYAKLPRTHSLESNYAWKYPTFFLHVHLLQ